MIRASRIPKGFRLLRTGEMIPKSGPVKFTYNNGLSWEDALSATAFRGQPWHKNDWVPMAVPDGPVDYSQTDEGGVV